MQRLRLMLTIQVWKFARRSNVAQRLEDLQEDVLGEIFRLVVLADELVGDVEDLPPVLPDDGFPCHLIAAETLLDQAVGRDRLRGRGVNRHLEYLAAQRDVSRGHHWSRLGRAVTPAVGCRNSHQAFVAARSVVPLS